MKQVTVSRIAENRSAQITVRSKEELDQLNIYVFRTLKDNPDKLSGESCSFLVEQIDRVDLVSTTEEYLPVLLSVVGEE